MKIFSKQTVISLFAAGLIAGSCSEEEINNSESTPFTSTASKVSLRSIPDSSLDPKRIQWQKPETVAKDFEFGPSLLNAVEPSECGPTPFRAVLTKYDNLLFDDFLDNWDGNLDAYFMIFGDYFAINQIAALDENKNADYFGAKGEYTSYVKNRTRSLEKFWDMADLIQVRGQHTATLEDLDFIRYVYQNYTGDPALPDEIIDYLLELAKYYNTVSNQIPENPFFASDGFATFDRYIVIGDGLVSMLAEVGIDPKVVWSSILAHEWGHQIQFLNYDNRVYPIPAFDNTPESTRMTELEADFITGYYLTHKRGATYNWKRIEQGLQAFFEIGDCGFGSDGHHGTPNQRLASAKAGYELANGTEKKGKILSQQEVHDAFIAQLGTIINSSVAATAAR